MDAKSISCFTSLILFCISLKLLLTTAAESISPGQSLSGNKTIVSQGGIFELGFFTPVPSAVAILKPCHCVHVCGVLNQDLFDGLEFKRLAVLEKPNCNVFLIVRGCLLWMGDLLNVGQLSDGGSTGVGALYLRLAASELQSSKSNNGKIIGVFVGSVIGSLAVFGIVFMLYRRCNKKLRSKAAEGSHGHLIPFSYADLKAATMNLSERLGGGNFGSVFKGTVPNSTVIAVKKLGGLGQGEKKFQTEKSTVLDWKTRFQIAHGTAKGLDYLHEKCRHCIIHCDIKPANVLLDADLSPKLVDFGMAKLIGHEFSKVLTSMKGTVGYLVPEWIAGLPLTAEAGVYSYGMMLLEIISGKRNANHSQDGTTVLFPFWAASKLNGRFIGLWNERSIHGIKPKGRFPYCLLNITIRSFTSPKEGFVFLSRPKAGSISTAST
ncbi:hypothetical protein AAC387_Pa06g1870 [Persea americana]